MVEEFDMKLTSEPKPVRIRIKSGGEFHPTLDSLRSAFSIDDLKENENEKQFKQWLKRQGEEGKQIAEDLSALEVSISECKTIEDYFNVYKIFFKKDGKDFKNVDELFHFFRKKFAKNYYILEETRLNIDEDYFINHLEAAIKKGLFVHKLEEIKRSGSSEACFKLGKALVETKCDVLEGVRLLDIIIENNKGSNIARKAYTCLDSHRIVRFDKMKKLISNQFIKQGYGSGYTDDLLTSTELIVYDFVTKNIKALSENVNYKKRFLNIIEANTRSIDIIKSSPASTGLKLSFIKDCINSLKNDELYIERLFFSYLTLNAAINNGWAFAEEKYEINQFIVEQQKILNKSYLPMKNFLGGGTYLERILNVLELHDFNK